ncbi:hypothetical protein DM02DRAFT_500019, partial [Periconia macrospinosa]
LFTLALILYGLRIYTRIFPTFKLASTDYIISVAVLFVVTGFGCSMAAMRYSYGRHSYYVSSADQTKIIKRIFITGFLGWWASSLARISIGTMLLRFQISNTWRVVLWILISIQLGMVLTANICQLLLCSPIRANWEYVPNAVCWPPIKTQIFSYVYSGMGVCSDPIFAIMPVVFIYSLNRPAMERVLMGVLMALGIVAVVAGGMKLYYTNTFAIGADLLRDALPLFMWFRVEEIALVASSSAPFLKSPIERTLNRLGI